MNISRIRGMMPELMPGCSALSPKHCAEIVGRKNSPIPLRGARFPGWDTAIRELRRLRINGLDEMLVGLTPDPLPQCARAVSMASSAAVPARSDRGVGGP